MGRLPGHNAVGIRLYFITQGLQRNEICSKESLSSYVTSNLQDPESLLQNYFLIGRDCEVIIFFSNIYFFVESKRIQILYIFILCTSGNKKEKTKQEYKKKKKKHMRTYTIY